MHVAGVELHQVDSLDCLKALPLVRSQDSTTDLLYLP